MALTMDKDKCGPKYRPYDCYLLPHHNALMVQFNIIHLEAALNKQIMRVVSVN
jgi:hypothetical protein